MATEIWVQLSWDWPGKAFSVTSMGMTEKSIRNLLGNLLSHIHVEDHEF
jgi:hypothetical protein